MPDNSPLMNVLLQGIPDRQLQSARHADNPCALCGPDETECATAGAELQDCRQANKAAAAMLRRFGEPSRCIPAA